MLKTITAPGVGTALPFDNVSSRDYPLSKAAFGSEGEVELVADDNPLPVLDAATAAAVAKLASYKRLVALTPGSTAITERPDGLYIPAGGTITLKFGASANAVQIPVPDFADPSWSPTHLTAVSSGVTVYACYLTA